MWENVKEWLVSKKTKALLGALVVVAVGVVTGELTAKAGLESAMIAFLVYMGAQGLADFGTGGYAALTAAEDEEE